MDNQASLENKGNSKNEISNFILSLPINFYVKIQ